MSPHVKYSSAHALRWTLSSTASSLPGRFYFFKKLFTRCWSGVLQPHGMDKLSYRALRDFRISTHFVNDPSHQCRNFLWNFSAQRNYKNIELMSVVLHSVRNTLILLTLYTYLVRERSNHDHFPRRKRGVWERSGNLQRGRRLRMGKLIEFIKTLSLFSLRYFETFKTAINPFQALQIPSPKTDLTFRKLRISSLKSDED